MRFHVLHSPLGTLLAYHLRQTLPQKHAVSLICNRRDVVPKQNTSNNVVRLEHSGMTMSVRNVDFEFLDPKRRSSSEGSSGTSATPDTSTSVAEDRDSKLIESLIVTIPPTATQSTLNSLIHRLSPRSTIVLMQTGLGVYEKLVTSVFPNPARRPHFIIASPRHGAWLKETNHVVHTLPGSIDFSIVPDPRGRDFEGILRSPDVPPLSRGLRLTDIASRENDPEFPEYASLRNTVAVLSRLDELNVTWLPMEEGEIVLRRDLVVRAVTDALAVALGLPNGQLLSTSSSRKLAEDLISEIYGAFRKQWSTEIRSQFPSEGGGQKQFRPMPSLPKGLSRKGLMGELVRHLFVTGRLNAPMLGDVQAGARTQVRYGLGYLFEIGRAYEFPMPTTSALLRTINARESIGKPSEYVSSRNLKKRT
jgi:2-dehydropantoate 2-reductase